MPNMSTANIFRALDFIPADIAILAPLKNTFTELNQQLVDATTTQETLLQAASKITSTDKERIGKQLNLIDEETKDLIKSCGEKTALITEIIKEKDPVEQEKKIRTHFKIDVHAVQKAIRANVKENKKQPFTSAIQDFIKEVARVEKIKKSIELLDLQIHGPAGQQQGAATRRRLGGSS